MINFLPPSQTPYFRRYTLQDRQAYANDVNFAKWYLIAISVVFSCLFIGARLNANAPDVVLPTLIEKICNKKPDSVLCTDKSILPRMEKITRKKGVPIELVVGIAFAESSIHTNYNKPICKSYNNLWGLKGYKRDNGKLDWYDNKKGADSNGCWLYKFESIEQGTEAISNTLSMGYKGCKYDTRCISYNYVGKPDIAEESWIGRVGEFYTPQK